MTTEPLRAKMNIYHFKINTFNHQNDVITKFTFHLTFFFSQQNHCRNKRKEKSYRSIILTISSKSTSFSLVISYFRPALYRAPVSKSSLAWKNVQSIFFLSQWRKQHITVDGGWFCLGFKSTGVMSCWLWCWVAGLSCGLWMGSECIEPNFQLSALLSFPSWFPGPRCWISHWITVRQKANR